MKIVDALKCEGRPFEIPDARRDDLPGALIEVGLKVGAEIGVAKGVFSEKFCQAGLKVFSVDAWRPLPDYQEEGMKERLAAEYEEAKKRLSPYDCTIIRKTSMDALADIPDRSLDWIYIDAHHGFRHIADDLWEWSKKVKKGGWIMGHDYIELRRPYREAAYVLHVKHVVDAYTRAMKISPWFVLGRKHKAEGEMRDKFRSYFWINP